MPTCVFSPDAAECTPLQASETAHDPCLVLARYAAFTAEFEHDRQAFVARNPGDIRLLQFNLVNTVFEPNTKTAAVLKPNVYSSVL